MENIKRGQDVKKLELLYITGRSEISQAVKDKYHVISPLSGT